MIITFLGTGTSQGIPVITCKCNVCKSTDLRDHRLRSSIMIENNGKTYVIDAGPDFRYQMLREDVQHLDAIIFTHEHKDHIAGLDDIRAFNFASGRPMDIYAEFRVITALKKEFSYVFAEEPYQGIPKMNLHIIENQYFEIEGTGFLPVRVIHLQLPVFGYRMGNVAYITDASFIPDEEKEKLFGLDMLIINALQRQKHISHFNLQQAIQLVEELKPKKTYLTHISHLMGLHEEIERDLPGNIRMAYDRLKLQIDQA
ncbi:MAG: MBL fold metallo-hydrolase [Bacteroidia bacterium]|nr:MBL fold metallo-hydrolase [Bacteroidia bacterium]